MVILDTVKTVIQFSIVEYQTVRLNILFFIFNTQAQTIIGDYDFESGSQGWTFASNSGFIVFHLGSI